MDCLTCAKELEPRDHEGVEVQQCPDGHGVWVERQELREIVERVEAPRSFSEREAAIEAGVPAAAPDSDTEPLRRCPGCGQLMEKVNYDETSGIMIDTCIDHGVWLDEGELERVEAWIEANREELAPIREKLHAEIAENEAELQAAERAGHGKGPLGIFFSLWHYARKSDPVNDDPFGKNPPRT